MNETEGYLTKVKRRTRDSGKLYRTAEESSTKRWRKRKSPIPVRAELGPAQSQLVLEFDDFLLL